jgi:hypothetical protein
MDETGGSCRIATDQSVVIMSVVIMMLFVVFFMVVVMVIRMVIMIVMPPASGRSEKQNRGNPEKQNGLGYFGPTHVVSPQNWVLCTNGQSQIWGKSAARNK